MKLTKYLDVIHYFFPVSKLVGFVYFTSVIVVTLSSPNHSLSVIFTKASQTLNKIITGGDVPSARSSATMAAVGMKLYVFGGLSRDCGWLNDLHAFDTGMCNLKSIHTVIVADEK